MAVTSGPAEQRIPDVASRIGADVVVMGTFARSGLGGYLVGNTAEKVLASLEASAVTIKLDGFHSPVADESHRHPRLTRVATAANNSG